MRLGMATRQSQKCSGDHRKNQMEPTRHAPAFNLYSRLTINQALQAENEAPTFKVRVEMLEEGDRALLRLLLHQKHA